jgi:hypothetical protein
MSDNLDLSQLTAIDEITGDNEEDARLLRGMAEDAGKYLLSFAWCSGVQKGLFGWGVGGVAAVFLFEIEPADPGVDRLLWVVVGDLPPAYLVTDKLPAPLDALRTYVELMEDWITSVRQDKSTKDCIPVNAKPTKENADALEIRLKLLEREFLKGSAAIG